MRRRSNIVRREPWRRRSDRAADRRSGHRARGRRDDRHPVCRAKGAKLAGGIVIGLSPAESKAAHIGTYHLPLDYHDLIIYTGFGYSGRNLLLTRSADAVITIYGRIGTLNEFTIAFEDKKPQGVLTGTGGTSDELEQF